MPVNGHHVTIPNADAVERLEKRRRIIVSDLLVKVEFEDWHGVADAAMDLREIDAELKVRDER